MTKTESQTAPPRNDENEEKMSKTGNQADTKATRKEDIEIMVAFHAFVCPEIKIHSNLNGFECGIVADIFGWEDMQPLELKR